MKSSPSLFSLILFIACCWCKVTSAQSWNWVQSYGAPNLHGSFFEQVIFDNQESLIAVGEIADSVIFDTEIVHDEFWQVPSPALGDMLIAKFNKETGAEQWVKTFGGYGYSTIFDAVADDEGNIYCAGYFWDTLYLDTDTLISGGIADAVLIKLNSSGQVDWFRQLKGTSGFIQGNAIDITENGTIVFSAQYDENFTVDGIQISTINQGFSFTNLFIGGFSSNGDLIWNHTYQGASSVLVVSDMDLRGDKIALSGNYEGVLNIGSFNFPNNVGTEWDVFTALLDTSGNVEWVHPVPSNWSDYMHAVEIDKDFNVISVGHFSDTIDFGGASTPLEQEYPETYYGEGAGTFITKYTPTGTAIWSQTRHGFSFGSFYDVDTDAAGNIYVGGMFKGVDTIAGTPIESYSIGSQYYICAMDPNGLEQWIAWNYPGYGTARGIVHIDDALYTTGQVHCNTLMGNFVINDPYGSCLWRPTIARIDNDFLSVKFPEIENSFYVFPNPASDQLQIVAPDFNVVNYTINDLHGKIVSEGSESTVELSAFSSGVYFIHCNFGELEQTQKFVKL